MVVGEGRRNCAAAAAAAAAGTWTRVILYRIVLHRRLEVVANSTRWLCLGSLFSDGALSPPPPPPMQLLCHLCLGRRPRPPEIFPLPPPPPLGHFHQFLLLLFLPWDSGGSDALLLLPLRLFSSRCLLLLWRKIHSAHLPVDLASPPPPPDPIPCGHQRRRRHPDSAH